MASSMKALIACGINDHEVHRTLKAEGADARGLARHAIANMDTVQVDLTDAETTERVIVEQAAETTHLFYTALAPDGVSPSSRRNEMPAC